MKRRGLPKWVTEFEDRHENSASAHGEKAFRFSTSEPHPVRMRSSKSIGAGATVPRGQKSDSRAHAQAARAM